MSQYQFGVVDRATLSLELNQSVLLGGHGVELSSSQHQTKASSQPSSLTLAAEAESVLAETYEQSLSSRARPSPLQAHHSTPTSPTTAAQVVSEHFEPPFKPRSPRSPTALALVYYSAHANVHTHLLDVLADGFASRREAAGGFASRGAALRPKLRRTRCLL